MPWVWSPAPHGQGMMARAYSCWESAGLVLSTDTQGKWWSVCESSDPEIRETPWFPLPHEKTISKPQKQTLFQIFMKFMKWNLGSIPTVSYFQLKTYWWERWWPVCIRVCSQDPLPSRCALEQDSLKGVGGDSVQTSAPIASLRPMTVWLLEMQGREDDTKNSFSFIQISIPEKEHRLFCVESSG